MEISQTAATIIVFSLVAIVGLTIYFYSRSSTDWQEMNDRLLLTDARLRAEMDEQRRMYLKEIQALTQERGVLRTERISDKQLLQADLSVLEEKLMKTQAELALTTSAYQEIRSELHRTQSDLKKAMVELDAIRDENAKLKQERAVWMIEQKELHNRMRHLERIIDKEGLDTGPLDQGKQ